MDPVGSLSNHFSPRSPRLDGNTLNMSVSRWFQNAIIYLKWLMFDLGFDFPSYMVNFGGLNFFKGSTPSISGTNGLWYLRPAKKNSKKDRSELFRRWLSSGQVSDQTR